MEENITTQEDDISNAYLNASQAGHDMSSPAVEALLKYGNPQTSQTPEGEEPQPFPVAEERQRIGQEMALKSLAAGEDPEAVEYEFGQGGIGATYAGAWDPIDLAVDIATGGLTTAGRAGIKGIYRGVKTGSKALVKQGGKALGKNVAQDAGFGALSGGFMTGADMAGAGPVLETIAGLIGPTATTGLVTLGRKGLASWMKKVKVKNRKIYKSIFEAVQAEPDNAFSKAVVSEMGDDIKIIDPSSGAKPIKKVVPPEPEVDLSGIIPDPKSLIIEIGIASKKTAKRYLNTTVDEIPDKAVNINFARIESSDDVKKAITQIAEIKSPGIDKAVRGVQSNEQTEKLANLIGMTPEKLLSRRKGQAFNAEEAIASRRILVSSGEKLAELAKKAQGLEATKIDELAFRKHLNLHYAIQAQVSGMTAEAGRALQSFRIMAKSTKGKLQEITDLLQNVSGAVSTKQLAEAVSAIDTAEGINTFARKMQHATTYDMFVEAWINGLLSGPQTHAVNTLSNTMFALWQIPERFLAAQISSATGSKAIKQQEALYQAFGLIEGFKDGLKLFGKVIKTGEPTDALTKIETSRYRAITAENLRETLPGRMLRKAAPNALEEGGMAARAVDLLGEGARIPGRFLMAEDELFKSIGYRMELQAGAFRQASADGLTGAAAAKRVKEILADPEAIAPNIHLAAMDAGRYQTFTRPLGDAGRHLQAMVNEVPVLKLIAPFIRTPVNILKATGERTPLAFMSKNIRADIAAGGARRDLALARISLGSMVMATVSTMVAAGHITGGGPSDKKMKSIKYNTGWQPYSIKIGEKYYSYNRIEPIGMLMGMAADTTEIIGQVGEVEADKLAAAVVMAIAKNTTSKTYMRGVSEVLRAIDDPDRYGEKYVQRFVSSFVPAAVAQVERVTDPEMSATYGIMDEIKSRIPGYSSDLPPRRNLWAEPIVLGGGLGPDIVSPIYTSAAKESPIDEELLKLKIPISMPAKTMSFEGVGIELEPEEYDRFLVLMNETPLQTGQNLKKSLDKLVTTDSGYKTATEDVKERMIREMLLQAREKARTQLVDEFPAIRYIVDTRHEEMATGN